MTNDNHEYLRESSIQFDNEVTYQKCYFRDEFRLKLRGNTENMHDFFSCNLTSAIKIIKNFWERCSNVC